MTTAHGILIALLSVAVAVMAFLDPHPRSSGHSQSLWTTAVYPKVGVHFIGGIALAGLARPLIYRDAYLVLFVLALGALYEGVQWLGLKQRTRGVYTAVEALAVGLGALLLVVWGNI